MKVVPVSSYIEESSCDYMVMACVKRRCLLIPDSVVKGDKEMLVQVFNPTDTF
jgi:hypothetical protein